VYFFMLGNFFAFPLDWFCSCFGGGGGGGKLPVEEEGDEGTL